MNMGEFNGDEPEIEAREREEREAYGEDHAEDYKYTEEWLN